MNFETINRIIEQNHALVTAAEAHGIATGLLCIDKRASVSKWLAEVFADQADIGSNDKQELQALFDHTAEQLNDQGFKFDLMLPEDKVSIKIRAEALRDWCQGFLAGIGYAGSSFEWSGECGEILKDIVEFTHMDSNAEGEEDESALMEINEYIRVGVQLINAEFQPNPGSQTLH